MSTIFNATLQSTSYQNAKKQLVSALKTELSRITAPKTAEKELTQSYEGFIKEIETVRGRELFYKFVPSGAGNGALIELADGSIKYDLITGIGVNFFGYGNLELLETELDFSWGSVMQGNLGPSLEHLKLSQLLIDAVPKTRLKNVWLTTCGATANEIALKLIRQKKTPASKIFAFHGCFAGRTTALQEITDNPKYREGQPIYNEVFYLPFFDEKSKDSAADQGKKAATLLEEEFKKNPTKYAGLEFEIVQGEGGFNFAPGEFLRPVCEAAKKNGLFVWVDEIQTFGRTGEFFAFQRIGIDDLVDVVTVAKLLQAAAVIYTTELNPKAGLISGTFTNASVAMKAGIRIMEILRERISGPQGRVRTLEKIAAQELEKLKTGSCSKYIQDYTVVGGMIAFTLFDSKLDTLKKFLFKLWDNGAIGFFCGHGPYRARMLPPFGVMTDEQLLDVFQRIEKSILETAKEL